MVNSFKFGGWKLTVISILLFAFNPYKGQNIDIHHQKENNWQDLVYININPNFPIGSFGTPPDPSLIVLRANELNNKTGFGAKPGFSFEFGSTYFAKRKLKFIHSCIGLNLTWISFDYNDFVWYHTVGYFWSLGPKIGIAYSYKQFSNMYLDYNLNLLLFKSGAYMTGGRINAVDYNTLTFGTDASICVRFFHLMGGVELLLGRSYPVNYNRIFTLTEYFNSNLLQFKIGYAFHGG